MKQQEDQAKALSPPAGELASRTVTVPGLDRRRRRPELLFVDDEAPIRALIERVMRRDFAVTTVSSARDAMRVIDVAPGRFAVVLTDIKMPGTSGLDLAAWLRERHPHLNRRVGLVTGSSFEPDAVAFIDRFGLPCLFKPFSIDALRAFIAALTVDASTASAEDAE